MNIKKLIIDLTAIEVVIDQDKEQGLEMLADVISELNIVVKNNVILSDSEISKYIEDKNDVFDECHKEHHKQNGG